MAAPSVIEYAVLPLYVGWWDTTGIRPDGEIVSWSTEDELSDYSGIRRVEDRYLWLSAVVDGSRRYERLKALLPTRPAGRRRLRPPGPSGVCRGKGILPEMQRARMGRAGRSLTSRGNRTGPPREW